MKELYVIDAAGYIYRSYFAIRSMTNDNGESTNALFGFVRSILKLFKERNPTHCIAVFDGPNNSQKRSAIYPNYKAHRSAMPPDLLYQMEWSKQFCKLFGISTISIPGVEADDTMATIALSGEKEGAHVFLCTSDKDLAQMVNNQVSMLDTFKDNTIMGPAEVETKFGVPPSQMRDFLALTGDASDNIPGVPGIGPKTAAELLKEFGSLDNLLNSVDKLPKKKQELFVANRDTAILSQKLVTLDTQVDCPQDVNFFFVKPLEKTSLQSFYASMKFNSLIRELEASKPTSHITTETVPQVISTDYNLVDNLEELKQLLQILSKSNEVCVDTETTSPHPFRAELVGIGLGIEPQQAWYIPLNGYLGKEAVLKAMKPFFDDPNIKFFGHNLKYDYHVLKRAGIPIRNIGFDTILASYLLNTHTRRHNLDDLSLDYFGFIKTPIDALIGKGKQQITMDQVSIEKVVAYCCEDIDYTVRLKHVFENELEKRGLNQLYKELELPLLVVLSDMEEAGIYVDTEYLKIFSKQLKIDIEKASHTIFEIAGETFNINSPQQVSKILFEKLGLRPPKGTSTSADVLESLKNAHPIISKIQDYRGLEKLRSTYVDVLADEVNPITQRIHCTLNQSVAATGRLSCQNPNLQNIPVRSEVGLKIREAFKPQQIGFSYIAADYSQIELRLLAHFSDDPILLEAFRNGEDIHTHTASVVFHVPLNEVTKEMRSRAKAVNFGIIYGQGPYGLSQALNISTKDAAFFIEMYFKQYPLVKSFLESCKDSARATGRSLTITGRERIIPEISSKNIQIRNAAERLAVNTPFQGSAADLIKKAMLKIHEEISKQRLKGKMILQIHDELIFEVPDEEIPIFIPLIKENMEQVIHLKVPLVVDIAIGKNWKEC